MKKLTRILMLVIMLALSVFGAVMPFPPQRAFAEGESDYDKAIESEILSELRNFIEYGKAGEREREHRFAGSLAELKSAYYIREELSKLDNFEPVNNIRTKDGIESFEFMGYQDDKPYTSQNVVFLRKSESQITKKLVIATHYDSRKVFVRDNQSESNEKKVLSNDGIADNAASVATLIALVKRLDKMSDFGFDIEIVFFGANTSQYAGSKHHLASMTDSEAKNILAMINFDKIGVGGYNYIYTGEHPSCQNTYFKNAMSGFLLKPIKISDMLHFDYDSPNGLDYSHIAMKSDHSLYMERNINVCNIFSGKYEGFCTPGISEFGTIPNVIYTENDNYDYILKTYSNFGKNLTNALSGTLSAITSPNFAYEMMRDNKSDNFYHFWMSKKVAVFITVILFLVLTFVYYLIYIKLRSRSRKIISGEGFEKVAIQITKNLTGDTEDDELNDALSEKIKEDTKKKDDK